MYSDSGSTAAKRLVFLLPLLLLAACINKANAQTWRHSLSYLYGRDYQLGARNRQLLTYEVAANGSLGDVFGFIDFSEELNGANEGRYEWYGELSPRWRVWTSEKHSAAPWRHFYIAGNFERGRKWHNQPAVREVEANLIGIGTDWSVPGFRFLRSNVYWRDTRTKSAISGSSLRPGETVQVTLSWALPFAFADQQFLLDGFVDWADNEGSASTWILAAPQLKWDLCQQFNTRAGHCYIGIEQQYWKNKTAVDGVQENVTQLLFKWHF